MFCVFVNRNNIFAVLICATRGMLYHNYHNQKFNIRKVQPNRLYGSTAAIRFSGFRHSTLVKSTKGFTIRQVLCHFVHKCSIPFENKLYFKIAIYANLKFIIIHYCKFAQNS